MIKECTKCHKQLEANLTNFHRHKASKDGFYQQCKICKNEYTKTDKGIEIRKNKIKKRYEKYPEKKKAKEAVKYAVKLGEIPKIKTQKCLCCDEQAIHYHHWSYEKEHWLDVIPLCRTCHVDIHNGLISYPLSSKLKPVAA